MNINYIDFDNVIILECFNFALKEIKKYFLVMQFYF
jgi:hypothetical protein